MVKPLESLVLVSSMPHSTLHTQPINVIVFNGSSGESSSQGSLILKGASRLDAFSGLSLPKRSYRAMHLAIQTRNTSGPSHSGPLVLGAALLKLPTSTADRDRTVSRRSKPSSRTTLNGEQPYPWGPASAPGCDEPTSRCQTPPVDVKLLGGISLLSPEYLLSVERWPFHSEPPDHYDLLSYLLDMYVSQSSWLVPLH